MTHALHIESLRRSISGVQSQAPADIKPYQQNLTPFVDGGAPVPVIGQITIIIYDKSTGSVVPNATALEGTPSVSANLVTVTIKNTVPDHLWQIVTQWGTGTNIQSCYLEIQGEQ